MKIITIKVLDGLWEEAGEPFHHIEYIIRDFFLAHQGYPAYQKIIIDFKEE